MATRDYTLDQPVLDTLEQALREPPLSGRAAPSSVFRPSTHDEVSAVLSAADRFGGRVGVGTSPVEGVIVVDLTGLAAIREVDGTSQLVTAGAGCTPRAIAASASASGLELDLGYFAEPDAPLGDALARGEAAPLVFSVRAALPDGAVFETPRAPRRASGPAPEALLVGGDHRAGIVVEATLRLREVDPSARWVSLPGGAGRLRLLARSGVRWRSAALTAEGEARALLAASDVPADAVASEAPALPTRGRPVFRRWSTLTAPAGPLDLHGGWVRGGHAGPAAPWLEKARAAIDPRRTLAGGAP